MPREEGYDRRAGFTANHLASSFYETQAAFATIWFSWGAFVEFSGNLKDIYLAELLLLLLMLQRA